MRRKQRSICVAFVLGGPAMLMFVLPSVHKMSAQFQAAASKRDFDLGAISPEEQGVAAVDVDANVTTVHARNRSQGKPARVPRHDMASDADSGTSKPGQDSSLRPHEYVEQEGAAVPPGGEIKLYAIGSSSLVWMTWLDQLHLLLKRLGYSTPVVQAQHEPRFYPKTVPRCDDTEHFEYLKTARYARIGWSSWDFAYEGWDNCSDGFRQIGDYRVKCQHGPGCHYSQNPLYSSDLAEDASRSTITLLATWFNDFEQYWSHFKCFDRERIPNEGIVQMSTTNLRRQIQEIHERNAQVWVVVMAKYTQITGHVTPDWLRDLNKIVKREVEKEPRTLFVYYELPEDEVAHMYQLAHPGHPNCRGSKIMTHAIVSRLFEGGVLGRGLKLQDEAHNIVNRTCSALPDTVCHTSAMCWLDPKDRTCKAYSAGTSNFHTVCSGSVCEGLMGSMVST